MESEMNGKSQAVVDVVGSKTSLSAPSTGEAIEELADSTTALGSVAYVSMRGAFRMSRLFPRCEAHAKGTSLTGTTVTGRICGSCAVLHIAALCVILLSPMGKMEVQSGQPRRGQPPTLP